MNMKGMNNSAFHLSTRMVGESSKKTAHLWNHTGTGTS